MISQQPPSILPSNVPKTIPLKDLTREQVERLFFEHIPSLRGRWFEHNINGLGLQCILVAFFDGPSGGIKEFKKYGLDISSLEEGEVECIKSILNEVKRGVPVDRLL